jgi:hypothetical protein
MPPAEYMRVRYFCQSKNAHAQIYHDFFKIMIYCEAKTFFGFHLQSMDLNLQGAMNNLSGKKSLFFKKYML